MPIGTVTITIPIATQVVDEDPTGRKAWRLLKEFEPKTNKKRKIWQTHTTTANEQCKEIAKTFAKISSNEDITEMTEEEKQEMEETLVECERYTQNNPPPQVTERELKRALRKANKKSAKGHGDVTTIMIVNACNNDNNFNTLLNAINTSR